MLIVCMLTYNDMPLVKRAVESVIDKADRIICVDGVYNGFRQDDDEQSIDGTIEYLKTIPKVELYYLPFTTQILKRSSYFQGQPGDYYLILDSDEEVDGEIELPDHPTVGIVKMADYPNKKYFYRARLIPHIEGIRYSQKHYWIIDGQGNTISLLKRSGMSYPEERIDSFVIKHHYRERSLKRKKHKRDYYTAEAKVESKIQELR